MNEKKLIFKGIETDVKAPQGYFDVMLITNIEMFGKEYYLKLKDNFKNAGIFLNKELIDFFDKHFENEN